MNYLTSYADGIHAVDANYVRPKLAAIHLIVENGQAAVFDTGTQHALPPVLAALETLGVTTDQVRYVIPSHVHLDHAGGAGAMMRAFPAATLVVHPRGARHMIDPSKLVAGTAAVYGAEATRRMYGEIVPTDSARIVDAVEGLRLELCDRTLTVLDTPGHARHHICLHDSLSACVFAGDVFGLSYRQLDVGEQQSVFPTTTPVQFEPEALHASIDRLLAHRPPAIYVTHYSQVRDVERLGADLHRLIEAHCDIARAALGSPDRHHAIANGIAELLCRERQRQGWLLDEAALLELMAADIELNAQGLGVWLDTTG